MIRVLCVEDDPLVRTYLVERLGTEPDIQVMGAVPDTARAMIYLRHGEIDVVLLDYHLHGLDGDHLLQAIAPSRQWDGDAEGGPAVLFCTGFANEAFMSRARVLGARGVVAKERAAHELIPAVRAVAAGNLWFGGELPAGLV